MNGSSQSFNTTPFLVSITAKKNGNTISSNRNKITAPIIFLQNRVFAQASLQLFGGCNRYITGSSTAQKLLLLIKKTNDFEIYSTMGLLIDKWIMDNFLMDNRLMKDCFVFNG